MKEFILDTSVAEADALKAVNLNVNIDFNSKALNFNGNQSIPYQGRQMLTAIDFKNNVRISELETVIASQQDGDLKTQNQAKLALANTAYNSIESAVEAYLQAVYELYNPAV
nr:hypothetical protein [uncultured Pedobacter sp.]